jgi:tRNA pseudouridine55 synthase
MNGVLVIDKPAGLTSHDVVHRVRLGTLDPMATGVLPLVLGKLTRLAQFYTSSDKTYEGEIQFGQATATYDAEGEPVGDTRHEQAHALTLEQVVAAAQRFRGEIQQTPPAFSAKKIQGVPAYKLARSNKPVDLTPVAVTVHEFKIESFEQGRAHFHTHVSSGTYVRCIAHELGQALGVGAHLAGLRRTTAGEFRIEDAVTLQQLAEAVETIHETGSIKKAHSAAPSATGAESSREALPEHVETSREATSDVSPALQCRVGGVEKQSREATTEQAGTSLVVPNLEELFVHPRRLLPAMPCVTAAEDVVGMIRNGRSVNLPELSRAKLVKVFRGQRELVAIASRIAGTLFQPKVVFVE